MERDVPKAVALKYIWRVSNGTSIGHTVSSCSHQAGSAPADTTSGSDSCCVSLFVTCKPEMVHVTNPRTA